MKILIDMQGLQSLSRFRGVGRYSDSFVKAFLKVAKEHNIYLLLNGSSNQGGEEIYEEYSSLLPRENIYIFDGVPPTSVISGYDYWRNRVSERLREEFIYNLNIDFVIITSLFEGAEDNSILSISEYRDIPTAVIFYDLIPHFYPEKFLVKGKMRVWYNHRLESLRRADLLLAISYSAGHEAELFLDRTDADIAVISSAVSDRFAPGSVDERVMEKFGIEAGSYIMLSSAYDPRKGFESLVRAYSLLSKELRDRYPLVLVTKIYKTERINLQNLAKKLGVIDRVILTGYVSDDEMLSLYRGAKLFVFPSIHEGFGLPPLEAMKCGVATIVSDRSSLPEVIADRDALFDPFDTEEMAEKITEYLLDEEKRKILAQRGLRRSSVFNWQNTAKKALEAIVNYTEIDSKIRKNINPPYTREYIAEVESLSAPDTSSLSRAMKVSYRNSIRYKTNRRDIDSWRVEGPFDSSYSLALLNRETALALESLGISVSLYSTEGGGDFEPSGEYLYRNPHINRLYKKALSQSHKDCSVVSRLLYPPRVDDMSSNINMLHHYAWEETGFPNEWVDSFNRSLEGMTTLSSFVKKIMIDNGVTVPIRVSGCGIEHWLRVESNREYKLPSDTKSFKFLHVSSCFPRKGVDILLKAYCRSFTSDDDVSLIIKTFDNPHNEIDKWLKEALDGVDNPPHILIIKEDLDERDLKRLYELSDVLVAPSRAEGFGLPLAEAMLSNLAVITTGWGGQRDFCSNDTAWLIDYDFEYSNTHFKIFDSVWVEPKLDDLSKLMQTLYKMPKEQRLAKSRRGVELLKREFTWRKSAERLLSHAETLPISFPPSLERIAWISSYNTRCGIADYSAHLISPIWHSVNIFASHTDNLIDMDAPNVLRCWYQGDGASLDRLTQELLDYKPEVIVIQFNYGFFDFDEFTKMLNFLFDRGYKIVIMMHSTTDVPHAPHKKLKFLAPILKRFTRVLVHTPADMNRLKAIGVIDNVALFPHGIPDFSSPDIQYKERPLIMTYGFALPHKGLPQLLDAAKILRDRGYNFDLKLMNARYPIPLSDELIESLQAKVDEYNLGDMVEIIDEYLEEKESLMRLSQADWVLFPYQNTTESSSAAVRYAIASGAKVAVTPLAIFDDVRDAVYELQGTSPEDIASSLEKMLVGGVDSEMREIMSIANRWRDEHRYSMVSKRLYNMLIGIKN